MTGNRVWRLSSTRLLDPLPESTEERLVLDLGIGPGVSALSMGGPRPRIRFIGADLSLPMLKLARDNRAEAGWASGRLMLVQLDVGHLPFADGTLDAATGHSFLYLVPDHRAALQETSRVLRPDGRAIFMEPSAGRASWGWLIRQRSVRLLVSLGLWRFYNWLHGRFSPASIRAAFEQAGLTPEGTQSTLGGFGIYGWARKP